MVSSRHLVVASAILAHAIAFIPAMGKRAPMKLVGIEKNEEGFGSKPYAKNELYAQFAPPAQLKTKNATVPQLEDRSLDLVSRQNCGSNAGYCSGFGKCCPATASCCNWGYCINPEDTCCPGNPCDAGWDCCYDNCSPQDGQCCLNGEYCTAGNQCVIIGSTGEMRCCTDLECTAVVIDGSTSYAPTQTQDPINEPTITAPPAAPPATTIITGETWTSWYWTVTWWYYSFYWYTFSAESTVTWTTISETTTYTTTATDEVEASVLFSALSATLTFTPPPEATSLESLINDVPEATESFSFDNPFSTGAPDFDNGETTSSSRSSTGGRVTSVVPTTVFNSNPGPVGGANVGSGIFVPCVLVGLGAASGILMVWL